MPLSCLADVRDLLLSLQGRVDVFERQQVECDTDSMLTAFRTISNPPFRGLMLAAVRDVKVEEVRIGKHS